MRESRLGGGGADGAGFEFAKQLAERGGELFVADLALAELQAEAKRAVAGLIAENEGLRPRRGLGLFLAGAARFIAS